MNNLLLSILLRVPNVSMKTNILFRIYIILKTTVCAYVPKYTDEQIGFITQQGWV